MDLPVVQLTEDAELLNNLVSFLYPIAPVIPSSYEKVFALLAACQKYGMAVIQSSIRAEVIRGTFPAPVGTEAFRAYAIASDLGLGPEMESAARLTLCYPMTFESLGEALQSFKGRVLCDLVCYRKRCRDNLVLCLDSFLDVDSRWEIWEGCDGQGWFGQGLFGRGALGQGAVGQGTVGQGTVGQGAVGQGAVGQGAVGQGVVGQGAVGQGALGQARGAFPVGQGALGQGAFGQGTFGPGVTGWPHGFFRSKSVELKKSFMRAVFSPSNILEDYLEALKNHRNTHCSSCFRVHAADGAAFCKELQDELAKALDKVNSPFLFEFLTQLISTARMTSIFSYRRPSRVSTHPTSRYRCRLILSRAVVSLVVSRAGGKIFSC